MVTLTLNQLVMKINNNFINHEETRILQLNSDL